MYGNLHPTGLYNPYSPYLRQYPTNYLGRYESVWRQRYEDRLTPMWRDERFGQRFGQSWPLFQEPRFGLGQSFYNQRFTFQRGMF